MITVDYRHESESMTDEDWESQEEKKFTITKEMVIELIQKHTEIPIGHEVCDSTIFVQ